MDNVAFRFVELERHGEVLGRMEWTLRPSSRLSAFLAGAYRWTYLDCREVIGGLLRPLLTALCFAFVPQLFCIGVSVMKSPPSDWRQFITFSDAAPWKRRGFRAGFFLPKGKRPLNTHAHTHTHTDLVKMAIPPIHTHTHTHTHMYGSWTGGGGVLFVTLAGVFGRNQNSVKPVPPSMDFGTQPPYFGRAKSKKKKTLKKYRARMVYPIILVPLRSILGSKLSYGRLYSRLSLRDVYGVG